MASSGSADTADPRCNRCPDCGIVWCEPLPHLGLCTCCGVEVVPVPRHDDVHGQVLSSAPGPASTTKWEYYDSSGWQPLPPWLTAKIRGLVRLKRTEASVSRDWRRVASFDVNLGTMEISVFHGAQTVGSVAIREVLEIRSRPDSTTDLVPRFLYAPFEEPPDYESGGRKRPRLVQCKRPGCSFAASMDIWGAYGHCCVKCLEFDSQEPGAAIPHGRKCLQEEVWICARCSGTSYLWREECFHCSDPGPAADDSSGGRPAASA